MQDRRDLQADLQRLVESLRSHHDDAVVSTRVAHCDERAVIVHASVVTGQGTGPSSSGLGSAPAEDGAAELAENRAVLRALIALGVPIPADEPAKLTGPTAVDPPGRVVQFPTHEPEPHHEEETATPSRPARPAQEPPSQVRSTSTTTVSAPSPSRTAPAASTPTSPTRTPGAQPDSDDLDPADLSWNGFWKWAREHGFSNRMALEDALKQPLGSRPPAEVRQLMREQLNIDG